MSVYAAAVVVWFAGGVLGAVAMAVASSRRVDHALREAAQFERDLHEAERQIEHLRSQR